MSSYYLSESPFFSLSDVQRFFDDSTSWPLEHPASSRGRERGLMSMRQWQPRMDIRENHEKNLVMTMVELPGLRKEDVNVEVQNNRLIISGDMSERKDESDKDFIIKERKYGRFSRAVPVPPGLQPSDVKASMENGILTVTFPKRTQEQMPQRISIA